MKKMIFYSLFVALIVGILASCNKKEEKESSLREVFVESADFDSLVGQDLHPILQEESDFKIVEVKAGTIVLDSKKNRRFKLKTKTRLIYRAKDRKIFTKGGVWLTGFAAKVVKKFRVKRMPKEMTFDQFKRIFRKYPVPDARFIFVSNGKELQIPIAGNEVKFEPFPDSATVRVYCEPCGDKNIYWIVEADGDFWLFTRSSPLKTHKERWGRR